MRYADSGGKANKIRVLALDYGERRIGIAISDQLGKTAQPLRMIKSVGKRVNIEAVKAIIDEVGAEKIILGLPLRLDGSQGTIYPKVMKFGRALEAETGLKVEYVDERFTTEEAGEVLQRAGVPGKKRGKLIDIMAAQLILQRYLDSFSPAGE